MKNLKGISSDHSHQMIKSWDNDHNIEGLIA